MKSRTVLPKKKVRLKSTFKVPFHVFFSNIFRKYNADAFGVRYFPCRYAEHHSVIATASLLSFLIYNPFTLT